MRKKLYFLLLGLIFSLISNPIYATHLRAGDITARVIDFKTRTYEFTLTLYRDVHGVDQPDATLNFGDGTPCQNVKLDEKNRISVGPDTEKLTYVFRHSFAGDGSYLISFNEENRNANINNINDGNSVQISFYVETVVTIDAFNGPNNTPVLLIPPIDEAATGEIFFHNPGAYDSDGDSLAYQMTVSKAFTEGEDGCGTGSPFVVPNYKLPNNPIFEGKEKDTGAPATFTLDPYSGDLVWNTPGKEGEYNLAFVVEEWRKVNGEWVQLGYVTRDMQVTVKETDNTPPIIEIPNDTCVVAGTLIKAEITAKDEDKNLSTGLPRDNVHLESYSGIYNLALPNHANFSVDPNDTNPVTGIFEWQTDSSFIREKPYQVIFKAKDAPPDGETSLVDLKTWNITVVGPAPVLTNTEPQPGKIIDLTWDPYTYKKKGAIIQIYRKEGPYAFTPNNCQLGIPEGAGYQLVGTTDINATTFSDHNNLKRGVQYCYRLVVQFPFPGGGLSYASNEMCAELAIDVPVITNVTVDSTSTEKGQITVKWIQPLQLDVNQYPQPYRYQVFRSTGQSVQNPELIATIDDFDSTTFVDKNLNTDRNAYTYQVLLLYNSNSPLDTSDAASSVRLLAGGGVNSINLSWTYQTPWVNTNFNIYRQDKQTGNFTLIGNSATPSFVDDGIGGVDMSPEIEYCYYIEAEGTYNNPLIPSPLINLSQISCQAARDTIAPCSPVLSIVPIVCDSFNVASDCNEENYFNTLTWTDLIGSECKDDIAYYKLYYAFSQDSSKFEVIAPELADTFFLHKNNPYFYAGCYAVTAVDRSGNESKKSNIVCNDNCPYIEFPNIITPNDDKWNQSFKPISEDGKCPRFVESIEFIVVNRWGNVVYDSKKGGGTGEKGNFINWNGTTNSGKELASGVYFYEAKVRFIMLNPSLGTRTYKGWIQVLR